MATWPRSPGLRACLLLAGMAVWLTAPVLPAQQLSGDALVESLQAGGYVLVIRNARSDEQTPEPRRAGPANFDNEREITPYGQGEMAAISYGFRTLEIPVGDTLTSTAYRSRQSALHLGFGKQTAIGELAPPSEGGDPAWLRRQLGLQPPAGLNTVIMTHGSLIREVLDRGAREVGTAETLVYRPRDGNPELVARLSVEDWARLAVGGP